MLWSEFTADLIAEAAGCPPLTAEDAVRRAAIEFFVRSYVWRHMVKVSLSATDTAGKTATVACDLPTGSEIERVLWVKADGLTIRPARGRHVDKAGQLGRVAELVLYQPAAADIELYPVSQRAVSIEIELALKPMRAATEVPDELGSEWREAIIWGGKARLFSQAGQPWTDMDAAALASGWFEDEISRAKVLMARGRSTRALEMRVPAFR